MQPPAAQNQPRFEDTREYRAETGPAARPAAAALAVDDLCFDADDLYFNIDDLYFDVDDLYFDGSVQALRDGFHFGHIRPPAAEHGGGLVTAPSGDRPWQQAQRVQSSQAQLPPGDAHHHGGTEHDPAARERRQEPVGGGDGHDQAADDINRAGCCDQIGSAR